MKEASSLGCSRTPHLPLLSVCSIPSYKGTQGTLFCAFSSYVPSLLLYHITSLLSREHKARMLKSQPNSHREGAVGPLTYPSYLCVQSLLIREHKGLSSGPSLLMWLL